MAENPFAEPGDQDRTVIRPMPGGLRAAARPASLAAPLAAPPVAAPAGPAIGAVAAGDGPLAVAAAPLLHLLARLRNAATPPDAGDMRRAARQALRQFEHQARDAGVPPDQVRLAQYALCAALDDAVLNTPWGSQGRWRDQPLAVELHADPLAVALAGRGFFDQLRPLRDGLPATRPVLEIVFTCLALGTAGPYRTAPDGAAQLERIRHHVFELIEQAAPALPVALAPEAGGVVLPRPPRGGIPVWVAGSAALAVVCATYVGLLLQLNGASDAVLHAALAAPPAAMPALVRPAATPEPPPPPAAPLGKEAQLRAGLAGMVPEVELIATPSTFILRIPAAALFPQGNATLSPGPLLGQVAAVVSPGPIRVLAYTDAQPPRSVGFPSAFALTAARAKAVAAALAHTIPIERITAEGRAEAEPLVPNTTAENRARNRRIEVLLERPQ